jgi:hypothetical protein
MGPHCHRLVTVDEAPLPSPTRSASRVLGRGGAGPCRRGGWRATTAGGGSDRKVESWKRWLRAGRRGGRAAGEEEGPRVVAEGVLRGAWRVQDRGGAGDTVGRGRKQVVSPQWDLAHFLLSASILFVAVEIVSFFSLLSLQ